MDVVVPVIASCGPRAGQRAARGSRRRRRTDWGRKDRRTSPSWVSGARVAGALRPLLRRAHSPRRPLPRTPLRVPSPRLPGSAAAASPRSGSATFAAGPGAAARRGSPPAAAGSGGARRRAPAGALRLWGALGRRGCPETWSPARALVARAREAKATEASARFGGVHSGAGVPGGRWLFLRIRALGNGRGIHGRCTGRSAPCPSVRPRGAQPSAPSRVWAARGGWGLR